MKRRPRIHYTEAQKSAMWDRWQNGESMTEIARSFDRHHTSLEIMLRGNGGIRPRPRSRSKLALSLAERETISRGLAGRLTIRSIAEQLGRSPSTVSREIERNGGRSCYRAHKADKAAWERARRPQTCKLAQKPRLVKLVTRKMQGNWSPQQIAGWLKRQHPNDEKKRVSHETIYRSLFIQARGVLKKELLECLRTERSLRRPRKHASMRGQGLGKIVDAIPISERPPSVEDRAVPGHWEGDLIIGSSNSQIATLVERQTRYVMLVKVDKKDSKTVIDALIKQSHKLPTEFYKSLTWDRGSEMDEHKKFTLATDIQVYFCNPRARGSAVQPVCCDDGLNSQCESDSLSLEEAG